MKNLTSLCPISCNVLVSAALLSFGCGGASTTTTSADVSNSVIAVPCTAGATTDCKSLAGLWSSGAAICAADGLSYDVSGCSLAGSNGKVRRVVETVYPAERDDRWKNAKCNLSGNFPFTISYPSDPDGTWIIQLEGGGFCGFDGDHNGKGDGNCSIRDAYLVSPIKTNGKPFAPDGDLASDPVSTDADWGHAILVKANYCSSDLWTGTNTEGIDIHYKDGSYKKWPFTGHINFDAMMDILKERYGMSDDNPNLAIHFRGQSAGGWGVLNNSWDMKQRFPKTAAKGNLMLSSWQGYIPDEWNFADYPLFGIVDPLDGPWSLQHAFDYLTNQVWNSKLDDQCLKAFASDTEKCLFGNTMYEYITGSEAEGKLDLPLYIYQNRQDQLYMSLFSLPPYSSTYRTVDDEAARDSYIAGMNQVMGIDMNSNIYASNKIKWLYAPSDPTWVEKDLVTGEFIVSEENVHPPLCYEFDSPVENGVGGYETSVDAHTRRFWHTRGQGPGRGKSPGEVLLFYTNFVMNNSVCE